MSDGGTHCPFLNRADSRCAGYLRLEALRHSYNYCFGHYAGCQVYEELLAERRERRGESLPMPGMRIAGQRALVQVSVGRASNIAATLPAATQTPRDRWGLWRSVRRGIAAG